MKLFEKDWNEFYYYLKDINERELLEIAKNSIYELTTLDKTYHGETVIMTVSIERRVYKSFSSLIDKFETIARDFFLHKEEDFIHIEKVQVKQLFDTFIDWEALSGVETKESYIEKVRYEMKVLLSLIANDYLMNDLDYSNMNKHLRECSKVLNLEYPNKLSNFTEIDVQFKQVAYGTGSWALRRKYVNDLYAEYLQILESSVVEEKSIISAYKPTGWAAIDRDIKLMNAVYQSSTNAIEFKAVGNMLRDIMIKVAQQVYIDEHHHPIEFAGKEVSTTDFKRMLDGYFEFKYPGESNKEYRNFTKKAMELAHKLTHSDSVLKYHLSMGVDACLMVVRLVELTEKNT